MWVGRCRVGTATHHVQGTWERDQVNHSSTGQSRNAQVRIRVTTWLRVAATCRLRDEVERPHDTDFDEVPTPDGSLIGAVVRKP